MSAENHISSGTVLGTVSGTALTIAVNIDSSDLVKTALLAAVGAVISFITSLVLKWFWKRWIN